MIVVISVCQKQNVMDFGACLCEGMWLSVGVLSVIDCLSDRSIAPVSPADEDIKSQDT